MDAISSLLWKLSSTHCFLVFSKWSGVFPLYCITQVSKNLWEVFWVFLSLWKSNCIVWHRSPLPTRPTQSWGWLSKGICMAVASSVICNSELSQRPRCKCRYSTDQNSWISSFGVFLLVNGGKHLTFGAICYGTLLIPSEWAGSVQCTPICKNNRNNSESKIVVWLQFIRVFLCSVKKSGFHFWPSYFICASYPMN